MANSGSTDQRVQQRCLHPPRAGATVRAREATMSPHPQRFALGAGVTLGVLCALASAARADARATDTYLDQTRERWEKVARQIWDMPELGLKETRSSAALIDILQKEGFQVTRRVRRAANARVATPAPGRPH